MHHRRLIILFLCALAACKPAEQGKPAEQVEKEFFQNVRPSSLLQRFATNEEVANLVTYVASPLSAATNGAALRVDGGVVRSIL